MNTIVSSIPKKVLLNEDDVEWFEKQYPKASLSWCLSMLLEKFRQQNTMTPADYAAMAAKELAEELAER